jgi:hypothetical protein
MKRMTQKQIDAMNMIRNSKGRFFGLKTTSGEVLNAQFRGETDSYVQVYDRNNFRNRKFAKTSIASVG